MNTTPRPGLGRRLRGKPSPISPAEQQRHATSTVTTPRWTPRSEHLAVVSLLGVILAAGALA